MSITNFKFVEFLKKIGKNKNMKNLREYRKKNGILQKDLASQLGVAVSTFSGWESGAYEIDNKNLIKLANILNVTVGFLLDVENEYELFDDARIPQSEIQVLYDQMTPEEQMYLLNSARGIVSAHVGSKTRRNYA